MQVEIRLDDGSMVTGENADRVYERDERTLYIYDQRNTVLAIFLKSEVLRLVLRQSVTDTGGEVR
jgi:hypothetical protein